MPRQHGKKTVHKVRDLWQQGLSKVDIALRVFGQRSKESTVRDILKRTGSNTATPPDGKAKILVFDIETAPCKSYHWRRWKENIGQDQAITESYLLSWAAKWLGDNSVISDNLTAHDNYNKDIEDDSAIVKSLASMVNQADFVIAHNGRNFDMPVLRTRMAYHNMKPMHPVYIIDTLTIAKREFKFPSNALNSIAQYFGLGKKLPHTGFKLWRGVIEGDAESWEHMIQYNQQDVFLLEDVYYKLRPWDTKHPNIALYTDMSVTRCPCCGSDNIHKEDNVFDSTNISKFQVYTCHDCGKPSSSRKTVIDKEQRDAQLRNTR